MKIKGKDIKTDYEPPDEGERYVNPWDRRLGEGDEVWGCFVNFRNAGSARTKRSLKRPDGTDLEYHQASNMAKKWAWDQRCRAYDKMIDEKKQAAAIQESEDMAKRHIQMAMAFQGAAAIELNKIMKAARDSQGMTLTPEQVKQLAEFGVRLERLSRGEPETTSAHKIETKASWAQMVEAAFADDENVIDAEVELGEDRKRERLSDGEPEEDQ